MDDLISRQAVIEALQNLYEVRNPFVGRNTTIDDCVEIIQELPPTQQKKETGEWLIPQRRDGMSWNEKAYAECSACHEVIFDARSMKFCPQCGVRMVNNNA